MKKETKTTTNQFYTDQLDFILNEWNLKVNWKNINQ